MNKPTVIEKFADNGEHSHWEVVNHEGEVLLRIGETGCAINPVFIEPIIPSDSTLDNWLREIPFTHYPDIAQIRAAKAVRKNFEATIKGIYEAYEG